MKLYRYMSSFEIAKLFHREILKILLTTANFVVQQVRQKDSVLELVTWNRLKRILDD